VWSHRPLDAPGTMTLCGNRNRKKKRQTKDVEARVKRESKDEWERSSIVVLLSRWQMGMERGHHMKRAMKR
jgi:hypothetical protein